MANLGIDLGQGCELVLPGGIFYGDNRIAARPCDHPLDHLIGAENLLVQGHAVTTINAKLVGGDVERDEDLFPGPITGPFYGLGQNVEGILVRGKVRPPSALIRDARDRPPRLHKLASGAIDIGGDF